MGSGSYVDLVVIKPKDDVQYLRCVTCSAVQCSAVVQFRTFDEANVKGERKQKYTYTKGTTAVLTESVRKIQVRCR